MLRSVLRKLGQFLVVFSSDSIPLSDAHSVILPSSHRGPNGHFEGRAQKLLAARRGVATDLLAGNVQLLGLGEIKRNADPKVRAQGGNVRRLAEEIIKQHLTTEDFFDAYDDETYILCFGDLSLEQAEATTRSIAEEIRRRLSDEVIELGLKVDYIVTKTDLASFEGSEKSIVETIAMTLRKVRDEAELASKAWRQDIIKTAQIRYSPVWNPNHRNVYIYRASIDSETAQKALRRAAGLTSSEELLLMLFELDCFIIGGALEALHALHSRDEESRIIIPINCNSFTNKINRDQYISLFSEFPNSYKKFILFEIHSISAGIPIIRLSDFVRILKIYSQNVIIDINSHIKLLRELAETGGDGISLNIGSLPSKPPEITQRLIQLVSVAHALRLKVLALIAKPVE